MANKTELPPMLADHVDDRQRNRVRMELSPERAEWLLGLVNTSMQGMDIDDPGFHESYLVQNQLSTQLAKLRRRST